ncbi:hypothetical protein DPEC_G00190420 [Dallia pectoralis]|uniref:Uncharacterized protein n=1 Tax=Dallia pectoralis TaxID=75939 RepID=A0ACC2GC35_DALPE|nr:hypothetical protein DPEC_G00190420 [Dallia pectoralis]
MSTIYAAAGARDIASAFDLFVTPRVEAIVLEATNREGSRRHGDAWRGMDAVDLCTYAGLLILAGVYRSRGEAAASLCDAESGRPIFRTTMPLKVFYAYSSLLRFDDRETRPARRVVDKLAAVRELWDEWSVRLPSLYNPRPDVTVDEQLVPFRGRCPFRQYMPSKPARYGIKAWVCCDAWSSYAWKMQVYTGKTRDGPERYLGARVVFGLTEGLPRDHMVTCDNFFTSYELAQRLLADRGLALVGTVRKNKPELPPVLLVTKSRRVLSSAFAFTPIAMLVAVLAPGRIPQHPRRVLVQRLRDLARGPPRLDARQAQQEARVPGAPGQVAREAAHRKARHPAAHGSVRGGHEKALCGTPPDDVLSPDAPGPSAPAPEAPAPDTRASKRKRSQMCPSKKDCKTHTVCCRCNKYICKHCSRAYFSACANWGFVRGRTI